MTAAVSGRARWSGERRFFTGMALALLASISLVEAAVARLPLAFIADNGPPAIYIVMDLFLVALVIWDFATRWRIHPVTLWGGLVLVISQPLRLSISGTECWLGFAAWATELVR
ncbi:MAG TPA: hypothetical protein VI339_04030 [Steroidobacteraceae bacterium]|nr:hypothetical protein [Steroidobacteraceae bacterium]